MINYFPLILATVLIWLSIFFLISAKKHYNKIKIIVKNNPEKSLAYSANIIGGIVSGVVIIIIERIITIWINNPPKLDFSSIYNFILSISGILFAVIFAASFMASMIIYIIYKGLVSSVKK